MATHDIEITTMAFPPNTAVAVGDTVTWTNRMAMNHTVTADAGEFDSGPLGNGATFSHTFAAAGAVAYHCSIHGFMKGTVTAEPVQPEVTTHDIEITTMAFPPNTAVAVGDTVTWTNRMAMNHTVTADAGEFDSGPLGNGATFSHTFAAAGAVAYHCSIHGFMKGTVTAEPVQPEVTTHDIEITTMAFPPNTAVAVGDTVTWTNRMAMNHTVTADAGEFDSGPLGNGATFSHTFAAAGAVAYHCSIHGFMKGTVTAEPVQPEVTTHDIEITTMAFPPNTAVAVGDTVTWTNRMAMNHTVTADAGEFDSGPLGNGATFSHTFAAAGAVAYHCSIHGFMKGTVTAEPVQPEVTTHDIEITTMAFPPNTAVAVGDTVTWTNRMAMNHTVTADAGEFDSGPLGNGATFSHTFAAAGAVAYHCSIHGFMKGTVTAS